jgi:hypothetical protein
VPKFANCIGHEPSGETSAANARDRGLGRPGLTGGGFAAQLIRRAWPAALGYLKSFHCRNRCKFDLKQCIKGRFSENIFKNSKILSEIGPAGPFWPHLQAILTPTSIAFNE